MSDANVLIDQADPAVTVVTLNRPEKRNALSVQLLRELLAALQAASADRSRRVLILNANDPVFCAGLDLKESADSKHRQESARLLCDVYKSLTANPQITIVAAQGAAIGGGVGLLSACDIAIAADDLQIGFPEVKRGLVAALVTALVRRQVNDRVLRELVLLGKTISAADAMAIGLVNQRVPGTGLMAAARAVAAQAIQSAPLAVQRTKELLDELTSHPVSQTLEQAMRYHVEGRDSAEAIEGIAAFLEKREPRWPPRKGTE